MTRYPQQITGLVGSDTPPRVESLWQGEHKPNDEDFRHVGRMTVDAAVKSADWADTIEGNVAQMLGGEIQYARHGYSPSIDDIVLWVDFFEDRLRVEEKRRVFGWKEIDSVGKAAIAELLTNDQ